MARVCPRCGRETRIAVDGLCPQCYAETRGFARLPDRIDAQVCKYCGSIRLGPRWIQVYSFAEAVERVARELVRGARIDPRFGDVRIESIEYRTLPNWRTLITLRLRATVEGVSAEQVSRVEVLLRPTVCPVCKTRVSGEYDTVLQIRGLRSVRLRGEDLEQEILGEAQRLGLDRQLVDVITHRDGVDVYFTNTGAARKLAKRLQNKYGGRVERARYESVTVSSTGKSRARKTVLLRLGEQ